MSKTESSKISTKKSDDIKASSKPLSDLDWLKSKSKLSTSDESLEENLESDEEIETVEKVVEEAPDVSDTGRLFIRNLPFTVTEDDLTELFSKFGQINEV